MFGARQEPAAERAEIAHRLRLQLVDEDVGADGRHQRAQPPLALQGAQLFEDQLADLRLQVVDLRRLAAAALRRRDRPRAGRRPSRRNSRSRPPAGAVASPARAGAARRNRRTARVLARRRPSSTARDAAARHSRRPTSARNSRCRSSWSAPGTCRSPAAPVEQPAFTAIRSTVISAPKRRMIAGSLAWIAAEWPAPCRRTMARQAVERRLARRRPRRSRAPGRAFRGSADSRRRSARAARAARACRAARGCRRFRRSSRPSLPTSEVLNFAVREQVLRQPVALLVRQHMAMLPLQLFGEPLGDRARAR